MFDSYEIESAEEIKGILNLENTFFVFDTNVLLNLYSYQPETLEKILSSIETIKDNVFIPFQVRLEFENRRLNIISNNLNKYNKLKKILNDGKNSIYKNITDQQVYGDQIKFINEKLDAVISDITDQLEEQKKNFIQIRGKDYIKNKLFNEFKLNIGTINEEFFLEHENYKNLKKKLDDRFAKKVPPGFEDKDKDKDDMPYMIYGEKILERKYGDIFFLFEVMEHFKDHDEFNLIIISEEKKNDWVIQVDCEGRKVLGLLPQIKQQIYDKNPKSRKIVLMNTLSFIKDLAEIAHQPLSAEILSDVEETNIVVTNDYFNKDYNIKTDTFFNRLNKDRIAIAIESVFINLSDELEPLIRYSQSMLHSIKDTGDVYSYTHCTEMIDDFIVRNYSKFIDACSDFVDIQSVEKQKEIISRVRGLIDIRIYSS